MEILAKFSKKKESHAEIGNTFKILFLIANLSSVAVDILDRFLGIKYLIRGHKRAHQKILKLFKKVRNCPFALSKNFRG